MLSALIWLPVAGALIIAIGGGLTQGLKSRYLSLVITLGLLGWTIFLAFQFDLTATGMQFSEKLPWVEWLGFNYHLGVDGISLPLLLINNLLSAIAIYASSTTLDRPRFYYALILLLNAGVAGAFMAQDVLLFFLFYEVEIIPLYFLINIWGGAKRGYAATKFLIYTTVSGLLILASFLGVVFLTGVNSFDYEPLRSQVLPLGTQILLLSGILVGFGIKIPIFPFHTWLPDAHVEASTPVSVLLAGVLLKLGTYGLLRFGLGLFPDAWTYLAPWLAVLAAISVLYGALTAIAQEDMKKMVAYSSIAHMGYILLAAAAQTPLSLVAAVAQMISHGLISGLLFLLVGIVGKKTGTRDIRELEGLLNPEKGLPIIGSLMILGVMASAGIPGMIGFISEFLVFRGSFAVFPIQTLLCMIGTGLTAVYFLLMINGVFFGRLPERLANLPPVQWRDRVPAIILAVLIVVFGLQPSWFIRWSEVDSAALVIQPTTTVTEVPAHLERIK
jgi:NAD(P)H-quinone oxidoreductase subunit 4